jgi:hypothetical protein
MSVRRARRVRRGPAYVIKAAEMRPRPVEPGPPSPPRAPSERDTDMVRELQEQRRRRAAG